VMVVVEEVFGGVLLSLDGSRLLFPRRWNGGVLRRPQIPEHWDNYESLDIYRPADPVVCSFSLFVLFFSTSRFQHRSIPPFGPFFIIALIRLRLPLVVRSTKISRHDAQNSRFRWGRLQCIACPSSPFGSFDDCYDTFDPFLAHRTRALALVCHPLSDWRI
jgi:hypothetical protein